MDDHLFDFVITNARLAFDTHVEAGGIAIDEGRIARLLPPDLVPPARRTENAQGRYVLPGLIDSHVHFRTPGLTHKETWLTASRAAVAGGVTTVLDMPNTSPPLTHSKMIADKIRLIDGQSLVDYGFHLGVVPGHLDVLASVDFNVVASIKLFLAGHQTAPNIVTNPFEVEQIFLLASQRNIPLTLHAEDDKIFRILASSKKKLTPVLDFEVRHSRIGSIIAISHIIELVRKYRTQTHVLHVSSSEDVDILEAAAVLNLPITFEVTPHHLWLTSADGNRIGARAKISPALRTESDRKRLWEAVREGLVSTLGSDHSPHSSEEKALPFSEAPPGLPGVQELLPAFLTGLASNFPDMPPDERICHIVRLCATGPARLFGLDYRKGSLSVGLDADLVILDFERQWRVRPDNIYSLCGWSAYEGWLFSGVPQLTMRQGEVVYENGRFGTASGSFVKPERTSNINTVYFASES
jgi:dihydroorotase